MLISVVLPNFNGSKYLRRAIDSFVGQDHPEKELVIVDGKSSDGSHDIIRSYTLAHPSVRWLQEPDVGISDAVNKGNAAAKGDVLGFIGADDVLLPGALSTVATFAELVDFDGLYFNKYLYFVEERRFVKRPPPVDAITVESLLEHGTITDLQTIFYRRRVFNRYRYNPKNNTCMDYEMLFEHARDGSFLAHVDAEVVLEYMDGNISHRPDEKNLAAAAAVAARFQGDYDGPMWSDSMTGRLSRAAEEYKAAYEDCEARFAEAGRRWEIDHQELKRAYDDCEQRFAEAGRRWEIERQELRRAYDDCEQRFATSLRQWELERLAARQDVAELKREIGDINQALVAAEQARVAAEQSRVAADASRDDLQRQLAEIQASRIYRLFGRR